jgi:Flp pilus assembly protein TadD
VVLLLLLGLVFAAAMARSGRAVDDDSALWHLALGDPTSAPLVALARGAVGAGDFAHAATWARAAVTLDPGDPDALGYQVMVAAVTGRCDEARASFRRLVESTPGQEGLHAQWRIYLGACPAP